MYGIVLLLFLLLNSSDAYTMWKAALRGVAFARCSSAVTPVKVADLALPSPIVAASHLNDEKADPSTNATDAEIKTTLTEEPTRANTKSPTPHELPLPTTMGREQNVVENVPVSCALLLSNLSTLTNDAMVRVPDFDADTHDCVVTPIAALTTSGQFCCKTTNKTKNFFKTNIILFFFFFFAKTIRMTPSPMLIQV